jgi:hypothetical protein
MKILLIAILLSFSIGLWFGINIGKGNALYDNPLADPDIIEEAHESADDAGLIDQGKAFIGDKAEEMKDKVKDVIEDM